MNRSYAYPQSSTTPADEASLPENKSIEGIVRGLQAAHATYGRSQVVPPLPQCVIFLVQENEGNVFDQYFLSQQLFQHYSTQVFRVSFDRVLDETSIPSNNPARPLIYTPPQSPATKFEVTLVYFRAGYAPAEYTSTTAWEARLHLERSAAIKCPSVLTQLAGTKKVQQILAAPFSHDLENFLARTASAQYVRRLRATFVRMYPLDESLAGRKAMAIVRDEEESAGFVLKPQREGGGNNIYGRKIPAFLASLGKDTDQYKAYILMEMITAPIQRNMIIRHGQVREGSVISELGIYGVCLWRKGRRAGMGQMLLNQEAGFLLRTKGADSEEGGVVAGFGAIDSPYLV